MLKIGREILKKIRNKCEEYNREMPTEIKLEYDVKENQLKGQYKYDLIYSHDDELFPGDIFGAWFEEVKNKELSERNPQERISAGFLPIIQHDRM
ncbi:hypothetical protein [Bhargavaea ginsengi]|uniref:hypothetical protein n=1 Tax=Bhargavaea ginsengi TaxID=426757 RepID=UPI0026C3DDFE|nr:hypothetical protein [Bhargavaea ginsengi]